MCPSGSLTLLSLCCWHHAAPCSMLAPPTMICVTGHMLTPWVADMLMQMEALLCTVCQSWIAIADYMDPAGHAMFQPCCHSMGLCHSCTLRPLLMIVSLIIIVPNGLRPEISPCNYCKASKDLFSTFIHGQQRIPCFVANIFDSHFSAHASSGVFAAALIMQMPTIAVPFISKHSMSTSIS